MAHQTSEGKSLDYTCTGAVTNGSLVLVGVTVGVARTAGVTGDSIAVSIAGRFDSVVKDAGASSNWAQGGRVYYMTTGGVHKLTGVPAAGKLIGIGATAATTGAVTGDVILSNPPPLETQA